MTLRRRSARRSHRVLAHTADVGIEARGPDLPAIFEEAALALADLTADRSRGTGSTMGEGADPVVPASLSTRTVRLEAADPVALAFAWLNELVATIDVDGALAELQVTVVEAVADGGWRLEAVIATEPFDGSRVRRRADVKSATYHGLAVEPAGAGDWVLTAYLDV